MGGALATIAALCLDKTEEAKEVVRKQVKGYNI
ncbi:hypothetical protein RYF01_02395 [Wolbachia endosymbiont of Scaptomyza pallida]|nr:hypothetical protein [Wolbachia endosymbiont of Scaptomyza pallida]MDU8921356.1 hypothetical protein [Wolbachia endosymbiont of Scaptomyza pallida]